MKNKDIIVLNKIRDVFAHQYSNLDIESAWETIQDDLPNLKKNIIRILSENR